MRLGQNWLRYRYAARAVGCAEVPADGIGGGCGVAGYAETGRCTARRRLLTILLVTAVVVSVSGCGGDDDDDAGGGIDTTTTETDTTTTETIDATGYADTSTTIAYAELDAAALAEFREILASNPEAIAERMWFLGRIEVTPEMVRNVAVDLCVSQFDPTVVMTWLQNVETTTRIFMLLPANRLLRYSGTPAVCTRPPTPDEQANYEAALAEWAFPGPQASDLSLTAPTGLPQVSIEVATPVCDVLNSKPGGQAAENGLEWLANRISRGRFDARAIIPAVVWIVGASCKDLLPIAGDAIYRLLH
jgi:hypothetical protein